MFFGWGFFFALLTDLSFYNYLVVTVLLLLWYVTAASFGYFINDLYDVSSDAMAGKKNDTEGISPFYKNVIAVFLIFIQLCSFTTILVWSESSMWWILIPLFNILLFVMYSHPSIRLKEKPYFDVVTDALYAQILPLFVTFIAVAGKLEGQYVVLLFSIFIWSFIAGIRNIVEHQLIDFEFDKKSNIRNLIQLKGYKTGESYLRSLKYIELSLFIVFLIVAAFFQLFFSIAFLFVGMLIFMLLPLGENILGQLAKYRNTQTLVDFRVLYESGIFMATAIAFSVTGSLYYSFVIPFQLLLFQNESLRLFAMFLWHRLILGVVYYKIINRIWILFKIFVNYLIYYFRKYILFYDEKRARGEK
jgi:4-hydroxybenzoate polyprenyltransferase